MPTAAKLVAAAFMGLTGLVVIYFTIQVHPDLGYTQTPMYAAAGIVGVWVGWRGMGPRIGETDGSVMMIALRTAASGYIWVLLLFALYSMIQGILVHAWYEPFNAVLHIPRAMIHYAFMSLNAMILGSLVVMSVISASMAKSAKAKWDRKTLL